MENPKVTDEQLDAVLIGGRETRPVVIAPYSPQWPELYAELERRIHQAVQGDAVAVEHIGSTSVPGLAAKAIIDVLLTVADVEDEPRYLPQLEAAGFVLRVREPGHRMFRTPGRDVHIHVYHPVDPAVPAYLDLRDWLRVDAQDRELYAATKRALARRQWPDMNYYAEAKTCVIMEILSRARLWRAFRPAPPGRRCTAPAC